MTIRYLALAHYNPAHFAELLAALVVASKVGKPKITKRIWRDLWKLILDSA